MGAEVSLRRWNLRAMLRGDWKMQRVVGGEEWRERRKKVGIATVPGLAETRWRLRVQIRKRKRRCPEEGSGRG